MKRLTAFALTSLAARALAAANEKPIDKSARSIFASLTCSLFG